MKHQQILPFFFLPVALAEGRIYLTDRNVDVFRNVICSREVPAMGERWKGQDLLSPTLIKMEESSTRRRRPQRALGDEALGKGSSRQGG